jgi:hypothetical protein
MQHSTHRPSSKRLSRIRFAVIGAPLVAVLAVGAAVVVQAAGSAISGCHLSQPGTSISLTAATDTVKPVNVGLLERGPAPPPASLDSVVSGYIIEGQWSKLQPVANGPLVTTSIDRAVAAVRAWNAANPTEPRGLRLRVESGVDAPNWVKDLSGGPVAVTAPSGATGTVPLWWTQPVEDAYTQFIAKLAAYTDSIPEIREVTVGATMEFFGEIFIRFPSQNAAALNAAGYTVAADVAAIESSFRAHLAFAHTTTQIDVNGYQELTGGGSLAITQQLMNYALSIGLAHVQFANASLTTTGNGPLYALMQSYGPKGSGQASITFQSMPTVPNADQVITRAMTFGATSIELPSNPGTASTLGPLARAMGANGGGTGLGLTGVNTKPVGHDPAGTKGSTRKTATKGSTSVARLASGAASALSLAATALSVGKPASASTKVDAPALAPQSVSYQTASSGVC